MLSIVPKEISILALQASKKCFNPFFCFNIILTAKPIVPNPNTATVDFGCTFAIFHAEPTPVAHCEFNHKTVSMLLHKYKVISIAFRVVKLVA
jgi:hypothetical protein